MKKTKLFSKILLVFLTAVMMFSSIGCNFNKKGDGADEGRVPTFYGVHDLTATPTDRYMVKDGASDYIVVAPQEQTSYEKTATQEFSYLFTKATGLKLPVIRDDSVEYDPNQKYISIGKTKLLDQAGLVGTREELDRDGYRIVTKGNTIFLYDASIFRGIINAVYGFMEIVFNYDTFSLAAMYIDTNVKDVKLRDFNVIEVPDIRVRIGSNYQILSQNADYDLAMFEYRSKVINTGNDYLMPVKIYWRPEDIADPVKNSSYAGCSTNTAYIMNPTMYPEKKDLWFSIRGNQWCYTARGIPEEFEAMTYEVAQIIIASLKGNANKTQYDAITITQMDGNGAECYCSACEEMNEKYGGHSGAMCIFFNEVGRIVDEWMVQQKDEEAEWHKAYDPGFHILFFAYGWSLEPPTKKLDDGTIVPIDDDVVLRPNVGTYLAYNLCGSDLTDEDSLGVYYWKSWHLLSSFNAFWDYAGNFQAGAYPYFPKNFNSDYFSFVARENPEYMYINMIQSKNGQIAFYDVAHYLYAKLRWNASLNEEELVRKYFYGVYVYEDIVEAMMGLYYEMKSYYAIISKSLNVDINESTTITNKDYPQPVLQSWLDQVNHAGDLLEQRKDEMEKAEYERILRYVETEAITSQYMLIDLYESNLPAHIRQNMLNRMYRCINKYNMDISCGYPGKMGPILESKGAQL